LRQSSELAPPYLLEFRRSWKLVAVAQLALHKVEALEHSPTKPMVSDQALVPEAARAARSGAPHSCVHWMQVILMKRFRAGADGFQQANAKALLRVLEQVREHWAEQKAGSVLQFGFRRLSSGRSLS
jgi:hypothetical protein